VEEREERDVVVVEVRSREESDVKV